MSASDEMYRRIVEAVPEGIWVVDPQGRTIFSNRRMAEILGTDFESMPEQSCFACVFPDELADAQRHFARTLAGDRRPFDFRLRRPDGSPIWASISCMPIRDDTGAPVGLLGLFSDITERKQAEAALHYSEERLRASEVRLTDAQRLAKVGSWERNIEADRIHWSDEMLRILGLTNNAPPNFPTFLSYVHPKDREKILEADSEVRLNVLPVDVEYRIIRPDGEVRFVRSIVEAIRNDQGAPFRIVGATQDITEQVKAAELLREREERLKRAERLAHVGNWHWDIRANRVTWSEEMFRIFGQPQDYTPSYEGFFQGLIPQDRERVEREVRECIAEKRGHSTEYQIARPNGDIRKLTSITEVMLDEEGSPAHMFGACLDITDVTLAQEEAFARQKLETVGTLANGIAHDFNNLLGGVLAQAELALDELAAGSRPEEELKGIRDIAIRGSQIVRELMIYAGKESEDPGPVDMSQTVGEILELLKVSVSKHATLETDLGRHLPSVRANAAQISQIVMNLVRNASEAIGDRDGVIRVTTRFVTVARDSLRAERLAVGNYLKLEVSDTGYGMPPETQARVFEPFFSTKSPGRGLGLAVVHGIVRGLGGAIDVASEPGKGTMFETWLPCSEITAEANSRPISRAEEAAHPSQEATVLVVEDEDSLRQATSKMLRKAGFSVIETRDGSAALDEIRVQKSPIDVLFLDITLPGTPSREVFEEARRLRPEMRVIITSAYSEDMAAASLQGRFERFIRKPYRLGDLVDLIQQSLS